MFLTLPLKLASNSRTAAFTIALCAKISLWTNLKQILKIFLELLIHCQMIWLALLEGGTLWYVSSPGFCNCITSCSNNLHKLGNKLVTLDECLVHVQSDLQPFFALVFASHFTYTVQSYAQQSYAQQSAP